MGEVSLKRPECNAYTLLVMKNGSRRIDVAHDAIGQGVARLARRVGLPLQLHTSQTRCGSTLMPRQRQRVGAEACPHHLSHL